MHGIRTACNLTEMEVCEHLMLFHIGLFFHIVILLTCGGPGRGHCPASLLLRLLFARRQRHHMDQEAFFFLLNRDPLSAYVLCKIRVKIT